MYSRSLKNPDRECELHVSLRARVFQTDGLYKSLVTIVVNTMAKKVI